MLTSQHAINLLLHITFQEKKKASHKISLFLWFFLLSNWYWNDINLASERWYQFDFISMLQYDVVSVQITFQQKVCHFYIHTHRIWKKRKCFHRVNHVFYNSYYYLIDVDMPTIRCKRPCQFDVIWVPKVWGSVINYFSTQIISLFCCYTLHFKKRKRLHTKYHYFYDFFCYRIDIEMTSIWHQRDDINLMSFQCWQYDVVSVQITFQQKVCHFYIPTHRIWKKENIFHRVNHVFYNSYCYLIDVHMPTIWCKRPCQFDVIWVPKVWGSVYKLLLNTNYIIILLLHITFQEKKKASHKISLFLWFFLLSNWYWNDINLASERFYQFDVISMLTVCCSKCTNYFSTKSMSLLYTYTPNMKKKKMFSQSKSCIL